MSADSFAAFRKSAGDDLANLAEEHFNHDLQEEDRTALKSAASKLSTHALVGSLAGLALGAYLAYKLRANRTAMYKAFRTSEKPTHLKFANGREEPIPDISPLLKPSTLGDIATYTFFAAGGVFFGGELGLLTGSWSAKRSITRDPETRRRIEKAWKGFRVDMLRKQADDLEKSSGTEVGGLLR